MPALTWSLPPDPPPRFIFADATLRVDPARGTPGALDVEIGLRQRSPEEQYNPFLDDSFPLPVRLVAFDDQQQFLGDLLPHRASGTELPPSTLWMPGGERGRRFRFQWKRRGDERVLAGERGQTLTVPQGTRFVYLQAVFMRRLRARSPDRSDKLQGAELTRQWFDPALEREAFRSPPVKVEWKDEQTAAPERADAPPSPANAGDLSRDPWQFRATLEVETNSGDRTLTARVRLANVGSQGATIFQPNDSLDRCVKLAILDDKGEEVKDLFAVDGFHGSLPSEAEWWYLPPGAFVESSRSPRCSFLFEGGKATIPAGRYSVQLVYLHPFMSVGPWDPFDPPDLVGRLDLTKRVSYSERVRTEWPTLVTQWRQIRKPTPLFRSNAVELDLPIRK